MNPRNPRQRDNDSGFPMALVVLSNALPRCLYYPGMEGHVLDKPPNSDDTPKDA